MEQRRRFWMVGPVIVLALVFGVVIGKGWERTGHATETYEELKTFSGSAPRPLPPRHRSRTAEPVPRPPGSAARPPAGHRSTPGRSPLDRGLNGRLHRVPAPAS